jgi:hypothetical protein
MHLSKAAQDHSAMKSDVAKDFLSNVRVLQSNKSLIGSCLLISNFVGIQYGQFLHQDLYRPKSSGPSLWYKTRHSHNTLGFIRNGYRSHKSKDLFISL